MQRTYPAFWTLVWALAGVTLSPLQARAQLTVQSPLGVTVTRCAQSSTAQVASSCKTLPAALVPHLHPRDRISMSFPGFSPPATPTRYHFNVVSITGSGVDRWLVNASAGDDDRLFSDSGGPRTGSMPTITYDGLSSLVFFVFPEDRKTQGFENVKMTVAQSGSSFLNDAQAINPTIAQQTWFETFLNQLQDPNGLSPVASGADRLENIAEGAGASPGSVSNCYSAYTAADPNRQRDIAVCIAGVLPTQPPSAAAGPIDASFFGAATSSLLTNVYTAPYVAVLASIARFIIGLGKTSYEYLPAALTFVDVPGQTQQQFLTTAAIPQVRSQGATTSDAVYFTIGQSTEPVTPAVVTTFGSPWDSFGSACVTPGVSSNSIQVPFQLSTQVSSGAGSAYVHDVILTALALKADGSFAGEQYFAFDPRLISYTLPLFQPISSYPGYLDGRSDVYRLQFGAEFGFVPIQSVQSAYLVINRKAVWALSSSDLRKLTSGNQSVNIRVASVEAACFDHANLEQNGVIQSASSLSVIRRTWNSLEISLNATQLSAGQATLHIYRLLTAGPDDVPLMISSAPSQPNPSPQPAYVGDVTVGLVGARMDAASQLTIDRMTFDAQRTGTGNFACFHGSEAVRQGAAQTVSASLASRNVGYSILFPMLIQPPRPRLRNPQLGRYSPDSFLSQDDPARLISTDYITETLDVSGLPAGHAYEVMVRSHRDSSTDCDALADVEDAADFPGGAVLSPNNISLDGNHLTITLRPFDYVEPSEGALDVQLIDETIRAPSDWVPLPLRLINAPEIESFNCNRLMCEITGASLDRILWAIDSSGQRYNIQGCAGKIPTTCVDVPRLQAYRLAVHDVGNRVLLLSVQQSDIGELK